jgi:hypothetical protein
MNLWDSPELCGAASGAHQGFSGPLQGLGVRHRGHTGGTPGACRVLTKVSRCGIHQDGPIDFFRSFPAASYLSFYRLRVGRSYLGGDCRSHVSSGRAARSLYVSKRGATIDVFRALSGCRCLEAFPPRVWMSYLSGDMQFSCIVEKSNTFALCR